MKTSLSACAEARLVPGYRHSDENKMAFEKTWLVLIAGCGVLGLAIWGGMNALTLKTTLLWMFISFGFLTLTMHLFGSPISVLLGKVFHTSGDDGKSRRGEDVSSDY